MKKGRGGFTLIELLVVVVVIGLLAIIALPRFGSARAKAHRAQMQTDLRSLVSAMEAYFESYTEYTTTVADLDYNQTRNVTVEVLEVAPNGWSAIAIHASVANECGLYIGSVTPPAGIPLSGEGIIGCTE